MNSEDTRAVSQKVVQVLLISPFDEDHQHLRDILKHSNWQQHGARSQSESFDFLRENVTPVVICESELPDGNWQDVPGSAWPNAVSSVAGGHFPNGRRPPVVRGAEPGRLQCPGQAAEHEGSLSRGRSRLALVEAAVGTSPTVSCAHRLKQTRGAGSQLAAASQAACCFTQRAPHAGPA